MMQRKIFLRPERKRSLVTKLGLGYHQRKDLHYKDLLPQPQPLTRLRMKGMIMFRLTRIPSKKLRYGHQVHINQRYEESLHPRRIPALPQTTQKNYSPLSLLDIRQGRRHPKQLRPPQAVQVRVQAFQHRAGKGLLHPLPQGNQAQFHFREWILKIRKFQLLLE